jgi:large subunit ribosomal protein L35
VPKMKTHKATSKRFRRTKGGKGKLMRTRAGQSHFRRKRRKSRKRKFYQLTEVENDGLRERVRNLVPGIGGLDVRHDQEPYVPKAEREENQDEERES